METLKALPGAIQMISGESKFFSTEAQRFVDELKNHSTGSSPYTVISIIGPQNTGKSYLLNKTFGTNFAVLDAKKDWKQTTQGIWITRCIDSCNDSCMIIMDVEGSDGIERGDDTLFERRSALFSLTVSDFLLLNMRFHDTSRLQGASWELIKLIFTERVKIDDTTKTTIIILLRDYEYEVPLHMTENKLQTKMIELWNKVHDTTNWKMSNYIQVIVKDFPNKSQKQEFDQKSEDLAKFLCTSAASGSLEQNHCASSFAYSSQRIWNLICNNERLSAADHKLAMSHYMCNKIKNEIQCSLDQDTGYRSLMSDTSKSVKEFHTELLLILPRILTRYEEETRAYDRNKSKEVRDKLEEKTLKVFKKTFKDKIVGLYFEKLSLAKPKVRGQLLKLAVRDRSSVIGVTHPYLTEFDDNLLADVHPYFQKMINRSRKEFGLDITKIAEEEANKIAQEEQEKKLQLAESYSRCTQIKDEILDSLLQETAHGSLKSDTSMSVKEFNKELLLSLKRILARYEEEARAFDGNIRKQFMGKLEEETLQVLKQTFKDKIVRLSKEKLSLAKPKIRGQLLKLAVRDHSSVIGVTHPYLTEFGDNLPADVHPYFQMILDKCHEEFGVDLRKIAEEEANKIAQEEQAKKLQLAESYSRCTQIKDEILDSLHEEREYGSLTSESMSVKEFNTEFPLFLERLILARYDERTREFDGDIRKQLRDKLKEKTLQEFKPTFVKKIFSLRDEILALAKSKVGGQLRKLPALDHPSVIGVIRPYLKEIDDNFADVHPYFQKVLISDECQCPIGKCQCQEVLLHEYRKKLGEELETIATKKAKKIKIKIGILGTASAAAQLAAGTAWAFTGDLVGAGMIVGSAISSASTLFLTYSTTGDIGKASSSGGDTNESSSSGGDTGEASDSKN